MGSRGKCSKRGTPSAMICICYGLLPCDRAWRIHSMAEISSLMGVDHILMYER